MLAITMITPAVPKWPWDNAQPAARLTSTPVNVRRFGEIRSLMQVVIIRRRGTLNAAPTAPVKVTADGN